MTRRTERQRIGEGVRKRLDECRKPIGGVVVDEDDLVVVVRQNLGKAIEAERDAAR